MSRRIARSFAFVDVCGFTRYMTEHGDETAAGALGEIRAIIRRAAEQSGIRVGKWLGDGALLVAAERGPLNECLEDIWWWLPNQHGLELRCGLATGPVFIFEGDDYIGPAVNIAARLCDIALPGEIVASAASTPRLPGRSEILQVRGIDEGIRVIRSRGVHGFREKLPQQAYPRRVPRSVLR
jgi:adenylate cyclase